MPQKEIVSLLPVLDKHYVGKQFPETLQFLILLGSQNKFSLWCLKVLQWKVILCKSLVWVTSTPSAVAMVKHLNDASRTAWPGCWTCLTLAPNAVVSPGNLEESVWVSIPPQLMMTAGEKVFWKGRRCLFAVDWHMVIPKKGARRRTLPLSP